MQKFSGVTIFILVFLSACASAPPAAPVATSAPIALPTPSAAKTSAPNTALVVQNQKVEKAAEGNRTIGDIVTDDKLGVGQMDIAYPDQIQIGESRPVALKIAPSPQLTSLKTAPAPGKATDLPDLVFRFSSKVDVYPVMIAELRAVNFDIDPKGQQKRIFRITGDTLTWNWLISPRSSGQQALTLELAIPVLIDGKPGELSTSVLQNTSLTIQVKPAPVSLTDQILKSIADNAGAIIVAVLGLIGTVLGLIAKARADKK